MSDGAAGSCAPRAAGSCVFRHSISVFFPAFNDAPSLPALVAKTFAVLERCAEDYEVIVVNDGSSDDTPAVLNQLAADYTPHFRVVTHPRNLGYGAALRSGLAAATKDWIFYTDGDAQYDPAELEFLLERADDQTALVNGYKRERHDPPHRVAIGWLYNRFARALFRIRIRDVDCDFRLIQAKFLDRSRLQSTSGTICVEIVRTLELSGGRVSEVAVSHYPRLHGHSQFFRVRSLATTFSQLCSLFVGLVLAPAFRQRLQCLPTSRRMHAAAICTALLLLCVVAYGRALNMPLIGDDYLQIHLARQYGPISGWAALAADPLYRCRATSLIMTYWTERIWGVNAVVFDASSVFVHVINCWLVWCLGTWRVIGWRVSTVAAGLFAVLAPHQEAVIWYAALPELLVFLFSIGTLLCWIVSIQHRSRPAYAATVALFLLALLSKESAVAAVPLMAVALVFQRPLRWRLFALLAPHAALAAAYFLLGFAHRASHLHFNDGTFSFDAPVGRVLVNSTARLFWIWGFAALVLLSRWRAWHWRRVLTVAFAWIVITLLPYSFLTYMPRVPSRHTYFAGVGLALLLSAALLELWRRCRRTRLRWLPAAVSAVIVVQQCAWIWTRKHEQFLLRARPTEQLVDMVRQSPGRVYVKCFPYDGKILEYALRYRVGPQAPSAVVIGAEAASRPDAVDLCNRIIGRGSR